MTKILFVDDEWKSQRWHKTFRPLEQHSIEIIYEEDGSKTNQILREQPDIKLLLLDLRFDGQSKQGEDILREVKGEFPELPVIIFTVIDEVQKAIDCMKKGADFYFVKSKYLDQQQLAFQIRILVTRAAILRENQLLREERAQALGKMIGQSHVFKQMMQSIARVAKTNSTVLITGETGTGKELVARAIHQLSERKDKPFVPVNCAAIPDTLIESELFGHEKGAFTSATNRRAGKFEIADGGTIFLDEIGEMKPDMQVKLLRVLQEREFERVGGTKPIKVDVRVIAATNKDLETEMKAERFREDLHYRINVFSIPTPPLRERKEDIPLFVDAFISEINREMKRSILGIAPDALELLKKYDWPGNIRELRNYIERAFIEASDAQYLQTVHFPSLLPTPPPQSLPPSEEPQKRDEFFIRLPRGCTKMEDIKKEVILQALQHANGNQREAAKLIGMPDSTFRRRVKEFGASEIPRM